MKILILLCSIHTLSAFGVEYTGAFNITVEDQKIRVTSPKKKTDMISILVKNNTFEDIRSELASEKGIIKRFNLKAQATRSVQVNFSKFKTLFFVSVAPPFQSVELKFSKRPYEIPAKK